MGKRLFAGFAAVLLIAMTAIVPALMDLREILVTVGSQPGQLAPGATTPPLPAESAQRVVELAAHAYTFGVVSTVILVVLSLAIAYVITRAVNLPLLALWRGLSVSLRELRRVGDTLDTTAETVDTLRTACAEAEAATPAPGGDARRRATGSRTAVVNRRLGDQRVHRNIVIAGRQIRTNLAVVRQAYRRSAVPRQEPVVVPFPIADSVTAWTKRDTRNDHRGVLWRDDRAPDLALRFEHPKGPRRKLLPGPQ